MWLLMEIKLLHQGGIAVLCLEGSLNRDSAMEMKNKLDGLLTADHLRIVMDFKGVDYIDTQSLAILINRKMDFQKRKGDIHLAGLNETVQTIFQETSLKNYFRIFPGVEEACKSFS